MNNQDQQKFFDLKKRLVKRRRRYFDNIILKRRVEKRGSQIHSKIHKLFGSHSQLENVGLLGIGLLIFLSFTLLYPLIARAEIIPVTTECHFNQNSQPEFILKTKGLIKSPAKGGSASGGKEEKSGANELVIGNSRINVNVTYQDKSTDIVSEIETIPARQDHFKIKVPSSAQFSPGKYKLKVSLDTPLRNQIVEQDFTWGVLAINPNQSIYKPNQKAFIGMAVLDDKGGLITNAKVTLEIVDPEGKNKILSTENETIKISPQAGYKGITKLPDYYTTYRTKNAGEYKLRLKAETKNGIREMDDRFYVENNPRFEVRHDGPTRIYPVVPYKVKLEIKANQNFKGPIREFVPKSFKITPSDDFRVKTKSQTKILTWEEEFRAGEKKVLEYEFDAPDQSPQFYLKGPLSIGAGKSRFQEKRQWQIASDAAGDFAIYREATGLDAIGTSVTDIDWDTTVTQGSGFTLQGNNTDIDLADGGHYLAMYSVPTETSGGTNRSETQSWLRINDTTNLAYGRGQGYIRRTGSTDEGYDSGAAIIDVSAGDDIRVQMQRTDDNTATVQRRADKSGISLLKLDDTWDYIRTRPSSNQTFGSTTSFVDLTLGTDDEIDTGGFSRSGASVTLINSGHYLVTYNVKVQHTSGTIRINDEARLVLDGTEIDGTRVSEYTRGYNSCNDGTMAWSGIINTTSASQVLKTQIRRESEVDSTGHTTIAAETGITITKLPDSADYIRLGEIGGGQDLSASRTVVPWDETLEEDISSFDHDATNTERINIEAAGNYLFFSSMYASRPAGNGTRETQFLEWRNSRTTAPGTDSSGLYLYNNHGEFNRGDQGSYDARTSGSSTGTLMYNLLDTDYIELTQINEAANATSTYQADRMGLQGVRISTLFANAPSTNQLHFRWRDDTTDLNTSGGWLAVEDSNSISDITKNDTYRVRIESANIGSLVESAARTYEIQWGRKTGSGYGGISWTGVGDSTDEFEMVDTTYISPDGETTSPALLANTESYSYTTGEGRDTADTTGSIGPLSTSAYTEIEYSLRTTDDAVTGATYAFRLYDTTAGAPLDGYSQYPEITVSSVVISDISMEWGTVSNVSDDGWTTINFTGSYTNPVFVGMVNYANNIGNESDGDADSVVCRVQNVGSTSAQVRLQEPGAPGSLTQNETIHWIVVEEGEYDTSDIKMEAFTYNSTVTDSDTSWVGQQQTYTQSYTSPVVLGQVMTYNDADYSVFWARGSSYSVPPDSSNLYTGKHVAEDPDTVRNNETVGVIVIEQGNGTLDTVDYEARLQTQTIDRIDDAPPSSYTFNQAFTSTPTTAIGSLAAISGTNGCHPVLYGSTPLSTTTINLVMPEEEINDTEQTGNTEYVPYIVFESAGTYEGTQIALDQTTFRFYNNADSVQPGSALGNENAAITGVATNDIIRIRASIQVGLKDLAVSTKAFKLQYGQGSDGGSIGTWFDVGAVDSGTIWRGEDVNSTPPPPSDGDSITASLLNSQSNALESYEEENNSINNPTAISEGSRGEWDWVVQNNGATGLTDYCFRIVTSDGDVIQYTNYPKVTTASTNNPPNDPTSLIQKKTDETVLNVGDWTNETSVKFEATASDPDNPDTLYLQVEVRDINTAFDGTGIQTGSGVAYSGTPVTVTVTVSGLSDDTEYHWRVRVRDEALDTSNWVTYGGNSEGPPADRDFGTDTTAPTGGNVYDGLSGDQDWNDGSLTTLEANWANFDATVSGLNKYEYAMRRKPDNYYWNAGSSTWQAAESWVDNGVSTSVTVNSMNLQTGVIYYVSVRATDNAGNTASAVDSDGQQISPNLSFTLSGNIITFADLDDSNNWTDTETSTVTTSTNASSGYTVRLYITQLFTSLAYPSKTIENFYGTWTNPELWPLGTYGAGYTSNDTLVQGSNRFVGGTEYAGFAQIASGDIACDHTDAVNGSTGAVSNEQFIITYKVAVSQTQSASAYRSYAIYITTAIY